jgi:hypothetical protein
MNAPVVFRSRRGLPKRAYNNRNKRKTQKGVRDVNTGTTIHISTLRPRGDGEGGGGGEGGGVRASSWPRQRRRPKRVEGALDR